MAYKRNSPIPVDEGGSGAITLTDNGVLVGSGTAAITPLAVGTNGQALIGSTGADPVFATISSSDSLLTLTGGAGTLDIVAQNAVSSSSALTDYTVICGDGGSRGVQSIAGVGTSGQVLISNGAGSLPTFQNISSSGAITEVVSQIFTGDGTYTPTTGMVYCIIEGVGGGGGGGGAASDVASGSSVGGGGGAGEYGRVVLTSAQVGASQTVTIGTAGAAGANTGGTGGSGGNTSVGTLLVCNGGSGGAGGASSTVAQIFSSGGAAGSGGTSSAGTSFFQVGGAGCWGTVSGTLYVGRGGQGGQSFFGGAPISVSPGSGGSAGVSNTGAGGGGGCQVFGGGGVTGGTGATGIIIITEFIS